jgi:hypothetical protein
VKSGDPRGTDTGIKIISVSHGLFEPMGSCARRATAFSLPVATYSTGSELEHQPDDALFWGVERALARHGANVGPSSP